MKRFTFFLGYVASIAIPAILYFLPLGAMGAPYAVSVFCGIAAFVIFVNQFLLATRPRFATEALGGKGVLSLHRTMPVVALCFAFAHRALKVGLLEGAEAPGTVSSFKEFFLYGSGFSDETLQAKFGGVALFVFLIAIVLAILFMANTFLTRLGVLKRFKEVVYKTFHLNYQRVRAIHNVVVFAGIAVLFHVLLASTSDFQANPIGVSWAAAWSLVCLGCYLRYRFLGRKSGAVSAAKESSR